MVRLPTVIIFTAKSPLSLTALRALQSFADESMQTVQRNTLYPIDEHPVFVKGKDSPCTKS
jgi:hypothetical protein